MSQDGLIGVCGYIRVHVAALEHVFFCLLKPAEDQKKTSKDLQGSQVARYVGSGGWEREFRVWGLGMSIESVRLCNIEGLRNPQDL